MKKNFRPLEEAHYKNLVIPKLQRQKIQKRRLKLESPRVDIRSALPQRSKDAKSTTVTVSTPFGLKSFTFGIAKRRVLLSVTVFTLLFLIFGSLGLFFSIANIAFLEHSLARTMDGYQSVIAENKSLKNIVDEERALKEKDADFATLLATRSDSGESVKLDLSSISLEQKTMLLKNIPNGSPVEYLGITSEYGSRNHPVLGRSIFHEGIDLKAAAGTKTYSAADGIVESTGYNGGYGNILVIAHAYGFKSVYAHLSRFSVKPGEFVRKGQLVAYSGNTGLTAGPHLHFEVRFMGSPLNPNPFLKWSYDNFAYLFEKENKIRWASLVEATRWQTQAGHLSYLPAQK